MSDVAKKSLFKIDPELGKKFKDQKVQLGLIRDVATNMQKLGEPQTELIGSIAVLEKLITSGEEALAKLRKL